MQGRRVWSDERVLELSRRFVAAADEVWRLQGDSEPECRFFREMVFGSDAPRGGSMQGTYVFAASGELLARRNSNDPGAILEIMQRGLDAWNALPAHQRDLVDPDRVAAGFRWEDSYPSDGLALLRTGRDLPSDGRPDSTRNDRFNRDAAWFSKAEARRWLPEELAVGAEHAVPRAIFDRIAALVFVDNVRGQTIPYHSSEVRGSRLASEVTAIDGDRVTIAITGRTDAVAEGPWLLGDNYWKPKREMPHSITTTVLGTATFDTRRQAFVAFDVVALGERRGRTTFNGRGRDPGPGPIGFVLQLAPERWRVAPTFINVYDVDWVATPN